MGEVLWFLATANFLRTSMREQLPACPTLEREFGLEIFPSRSFRARFSRAWNRHPLSFQTTVTQATQTVDYSSLWPRRIPILMVILL